MPGKKYSVEEVEDTLDTDMKKDVEEAILYTLHNYTSVYYPLPTLKKQIPEPLSLLDQHHSEIHCPPPNAA